MRKQYVPVNLLEPTNHGNDVEYQPQEAQQAMPSTAYVVPQTTAHTTSGEPILMAVAVPNSIRPPKVSHIEEDATAITTRSIIRRISILIVGLVLTYLTFFESLMLIIFGYINGNYFELLLGLVWFAATICVLLGSFVGAYRGQWRLIVPGLVLQHFVGVLTRLLVTDMPSEKVYD